MRSILFCTLIVALCSCEKKPTACIDMPDIVAADQEVKFVSCSEDFEFMHWEFGDGTGLEAESPPYRYEFEGCYTVRLTAYADGAFRSDETEKQICASYKYLDRFELFGTFNFSEVTFFVFDNEFTTLIEPGTYTEDSPISLNAYDERLRLREGRTIYGVNRGSSTILEGGADFTNFDQSFSETVDPVTGTTLRVYWRFKDLSEI